MNAEQLEAADRVRARLVGNVASAGMLRAVLATVPVGAREAFIDRIWDADGLEDDEPGLPRGCVPYLPCPVATVIDALELARVGADDVFVDVGAGLGRTIALAHLLTGAGCIGLEVQPGLADAARARADWLNLSRARFVTGDAADLIRFVMTGTVFFFYCPFSGARLRQVLDDLQAIARTRPIRLCCVAMPALDLPWLAHVASVSTGAVGDLSVYASVDAASVPGPGVRTEHRSLRR